jgi:hypothetical protein
VTTNLSRGATLSHCHDFVKKIVVYFYFSPLGTRHSRRNSFIASSKGISAFLHQIRRRQFFDRIIISIIIVIINNTLALFFLYLFGFFICLYQFIASERLFSGELSNQHNRQLGRKLFSQPPHGWVRAGFLIAFTSMAGFRSRRQDFLLPSHQK